MGFTGILFVIALIALIWVVLTYNSLRTMSELVKRERANITTALEKRANLANKLADIVKSYGDHEKLTQTVVASAVQQIGTSGANDLFGRAQAIGMAFPNLTANENYKTLMLQIEALETELQALRMRYNDSVSSYNSKRGSIPTVFVAPQMGFPEAPYFEVSVDGLPTIGDFSTDDGKILREALSQMGSRAARAADGAANRIKDMTAAKPGDPAAPETKAPSAEN
jgi:LemA protein